MKFKSIEDLENFENKSMFCICGKLMTGLHMSMCSKLKEERVRLTKLKSREIKE